ncbi:F-box/LRR-repeat protein At4g14103-like isoform X2 [Coffea eugenioides]|uniref:F-box/LRR-repeat protein At4g14103-like isoform X2 n=1 Tax=Coffea eugenioides TaxID=49369 RepID=UPI000F614B49|nr:F-box/LRR-repeat protein At4g14103-like isoform X2 [Coffea eugenioides]
MMIVKKIDSVPCRMASSATFSRFFPQNLQPPLPFCPPDGGNDVNDEKVVESEKKFMEFVNRLLMNCESTSVVNEFCLICRKSASCQKFGLSLWMSLVLPRGVQVLNILVDGYTNFPQFEVFPSEIFTCKTLVVLKLHGWLGLKLPKGLCLPNLKVLHLHTLTLLGDNTGWLLSSCCPLLDDLVIDGVELFDVGLIDFSSPSLTRLAWGQGSLGGKVVLNSPNLEYLEYAGDLYPLLSSNCKFKFLLKAILALENKNMPHDHDANQFCQFISEMRNLESFGLFGDSLQCLYQAGHLLPEFINLTRLELSTVRDLYSKDFETLLKSTPNLKVLVCYLSPLKMYDDMHLHFSAKERPLCLNQYLREVEIKSFFIIPNYGFDLVRYLLKHGAVLQKMSIHVATTEMPENWSSSAREKLNKFSKCSKNCKIMLI